MELDPEEINSSEPLDTQPTEGEDLGKVRPVSGLYKDWFMEYASYVILERAIPALEDGLKPVQRRILHYRFYHGLSPPW